MFVKLLNPRTKLCLVFECHAEATFEPRGRMTTAEAAKRQTFLEAMGDDVRRFVIWSAEDDATLTEVSIPGPRGTKNGATVLLTNWDAWLCNHHGRTIDRIHKHLSTAELAAG